MDKINRVIIMVLDSLGIGELPDAIEYGDIGANTLGNIVKERGRINIPNMCKLGLGKVEDVVYLPVPNEIIGSYGRMKPLSKGKDTITGHWEMMGMQIEKGFPVYPKGFPKKIIDEFTDSIGRDILGNLAASGTEILNRLGAEHMKTGYPIVYTSADSVFQIAAHEDIISVEELYAICEIARNILKGDHAVGRVIARPFIGRPGDFTRTKYRKDYSLKPSGIVLEKLKALNYDIIAIGKIEDIFASKGITRSIHTSDNMQGVDETIRLIQEDNKGIIFTNLVDFDMKYGHRKDVEGYAKALEEYDSRITEILTAMRQDDLLIITADHGCDPTTEGTDHSREYVPLLLYGKNITKDVNLGTRMTFADIASTISDIFNITNTFNGESFRNKF